MLRAHTLLQQLPFSQIWDVTTGKRTLSVKKFFFLVAHVSTSACRAAAATAAVIRILGPSAEELPHNFEG